MGVSDKSARRTGYGSGLGIALFLLLPLGGYALLNVYPSLMSLYYSLNEYSGFGSLKFVGLQNYANMLKDPVVRTAVLNGFRNMLLVLAFQVPLGLVLAFLLSRIRRGSKIFVFFFFLPVVVSEVVLALMWRFVYNSQWGMLNSLLNAAGLDALAQKWLSDPQLAPWVVLIPGVWQWVGFNVVLFLTAIQNLPEELFDAARIDGANGWQELRYLTLPLLRGVYVMATILAIAGSMGGPLGYPLMLTQGGPFQTSQTLSLYIYQLVSSRRAGLGGAIPLWGYASAVVVLNFVLIGVLSGLTWRFRRDVEGS
jgi:raffinose/stachyose/melibiose transport system permease protein